ncbi:MAG: C10 family peptidase, partial [Acidobacteriota bacterium]
MKKISLFLILLLLTFYTIHTREISYNEAHIVAENWTVDLERNFNDQVRIFNGREIYRDNIVVAYVFDLYPKGYVIVSPQDYLPPIKFYTLSNNFDKAGLFVRDVIFDGNKEIIKRVNNGKLVPEESLKSRNNKKFKHYLREEENEDTLSSLTAVTESVNPLLHTSWGQSDPYNKFCPFVEGEKGLTGCTPTAIAQILNYYEWPIRGKGSETYYDPGSKQTLTTTFDKEYEWWNMRDSYRDDEETEQEKEAVATLMFDVGVALHSMYGPYGTGTVSSYFNNIVKHFLYSPELKFVRFNNVNSIDKWFEIAKNQIDNAWVVEYGIFPYEGVGHSVVIDGYRIDGESKMIHMNFGNGSG